MITREIGRICPIRHRLAISEIAVRYLIDSGRLPRHGAMPKMPIPALDRADDEHIQNCIRMLGMEAIRINGRDVINAGYEMRGMFWTAKIMAGVDEKGNATAFVHAEWSGLDGVGAAIEEAAQRVLSHASRKREAQKSFHGGTSAADKSVRRKINAADEAYEESFNLLSATEEKAYSDNVKPIYWNAMQLEGLALPSYGKHVGKNDAQVALEFIEFCSKELRIAIMLAM